MKPSERIPFTNLCEFTVPTSDKDNQKGKEIYLVRRDHTCIARTILDAIRSQREATK